MAGGLVDYARDDPDGWAVSDGTTECSRAALNERVNRTIHLLWDRSITPGSAVAVMATNCTDYLVIALASALGGVSLVPVNWHFTVEEATYIMGHAQAKGLFVDAANADVGRAAAEAIGCDTIIDLGEEFERLLTECSPEEPPEDTLFSSPIFFTSGTTGRPKATRLSQTPTGVSVPEALERVKQNALLSSLTENVVHLVQGPLYHAAPIGGATMTAQTGGRVQIMPSFDPEDSLRLIQERSVTHSTMVPIMFVRLLRLPEEVRTKYDVSSLRAIQHLAAPISIDIKHQMIDWWGPVLNDAYGCSEIGVITRITADEWLNKPGSVGKPISAFTIEIIDDDDKELPPGEIGMIYATSLTDVDLEYIGDPERTQAAHLKDKQFTIGDMGWLDDDGYLYLADRRVDMINSGGVNIYPAEIESAMLGHPAVEDVCVIGVPSEEWGQEVKAAVKLRDGTEPSDDLDGDIQEWLGDHIAAYKIPKSIDFVAELPRFPNGKLHRRVLRDQYWPQGEQDQNVKRA